MYSKGRIFFCFLIDSLHARFFFVIIIILMQILALVESVFKSKQAQKRKKKSHRLFHMLDLYIFTFRYVQCSHVTRLHH